MAAKVLNKETKAISGKELQTISPTIGSGGGVAEVEFARCDCCGLTEECTPGYIARIRERHQGRWICGLCSEAVKYEVLRSRRGISTDEAMKRHTKVCEEFKSSSPPTNTGGEDLMIATMKQILRRTLDSPRRGGEGFGRGLRPLGRSKSCFATIPESQRE
ncbi:hypothetical protein PanWU01x14_059630 [Parasponia andersonii]|uniref:DUF1677 family protein n=1 Tax=Parasponia andersonii TaxID=3476 RepID=A0A2P5DIJ3_PARAD|nr:hypothetical protein PanWU01x14_059630 [Parasponia andersonii]